MASSPLAGPEPSGRQRPQAPSLDVMTAQAAAAPIAFPLDDSDPAAVSAIQESRSSSSTNSPLPNDNEESDFFINANDSQSSVGVSNLQDMQVHDDDDSAAHRDSAAPDEEELCIPPINRLPNEILIAIFAKLGTSSDQLHCMLTCKRWARNTVDLLWHRPACTSWPRHESICQTLVVPQPFFSYKDFIKRINLASIASKVNDGSVTPLAMCNRIERLTLPNCKNLTDIGLIALIENSSHLLALDISGDDQITEATIYAIAEHCRRLQGLNVSGCTRISNEGLIRLAESCKYIKRIKLNDCTQLTNQAVLAFARNCCNILEIDLHQCRQISNISVTELLTHGQALRELRLANCDLIGDDAFLNLPPNQKFPHLRILDLTSCVRLNDIAVCRIIRVAPRLRNLVLAKCRNLTDSAVLHIAQLGKNLHYVHLGHCNLITDDAVKRLVQSCNRIRYIDLGCCTNLTDDSVTRLATLPKLKRIGLVKCNNITDESVLALARANQRSRQRRDADGNIYLSHSSLERVHLSYCSRLGIHSIIRLLESCPRLTHLSLTGINAFIREDLSVFCRVPPEEFTQHQRDLFCVFSGEGVVHLRHHLATSPDYAEYRQPPSTLSMSRQPPPPPPLGVEAAEYAPPAALFDTNDPYIVDEVDDMDDSTIMAIDPQTADNSDTPLGLPIPIPTQPASLVPTAVPVTPNPVYPGFVLHPQGQNVTPVLSTFPVLADMASIPAPYSAAAASASEPIFPSWISPLMPFTPAAGPSTASAVGPTTAGASTAPLGAGTEASQAIVPATDAAAATTETAWPGVATAAESSSISRSSTPGDL